MTMVLRRGGAQRSARAGLVSMALLGGLLIGSPSAVASTGVVPAVTDGVNGEVLASVQVGDRTIIGGNFSWAGPSTASAVPVDAGTGRRLSLPTVRGLVRTAVPDGVGGWYVGGDFTYAGGKVRSGAARISPQGFVTAWNPMPTGQVHSLAVSNGVVYLGGAFTAMGGQARSNIAAVDASSGALLDWNPGANNTVSSLAVSADRSTLYAGGAFNSLAGQPRAHVGAVDVATGSATGWNPGIDGPVSDLEVSGSLVYVAGSFAAAGDASRANLAALDASTGTVSNWAPATDGPVAALAITAGTVYAGGAFTALGGASRANLGAVSATTGETTAWNAGVNGPVKTLALNTTGATLYAGGSFTEAVNQQRMRGASFSTTTGTLTGWDPSAEADVNAVAVAGARVLVGGAFTMLNGLPRHNAAAIRADGTVDPAWNPNLNSTVYALAASDDGTTIFIGGAFTSAGASTRSRLAAVNGTFGAVLPTWTTGISNNNTVRALAASGDRLYVGGTFAKIGGRDINRLAVVDQASGAVQPDFTPRPDGSVKALTVSPDGEYVYPGGLFDNIGGAARPGVAELNAANGSATTFAPTAGGDGIAIDLTPDGSRLFFSISNNRTFAYDPRSTTNTPKYIVRMGGDVQAIAATSTEVYIGGHFRNALDPTRPRRHLASFRVADGTLTDWITNADGIMGVWTITITPTALAIGGDFDKVRGKDQKGFARFPGTP